jgi:hypothetical protein
MYGDDPKAEKLAKIWGEQIARYLTENVRDGELERLRAELAGAQAYSRGAAEDYNTACDERDALRAAIEKLSARHQPKQAKQWIRCDRHADMPMRDSRQFLMCTKCRTEPVTVCSNLTCCEWPCDDRRAIESLMAAPESPEDAS